MYVYKEAVSLLLLSLLCLSWSSPPFEVHCCLLCHLVCVFYVADLYDLLKIYHTACASIIYQTLYPSSYQCSQTSKYMLVECCTVMTESVKHPVISCRIPVLSVASASLSLLRVHFSHRREFVTACYYNALLSISRNHFFLYVYFGKRNASKATP